MTAAITGNSGLDVRVRGRRGKIEMLNFGPTGKVGNVTHGSFHSHKIEETGNKMAV